MKFLSDALIEGGATGHKSLSLYCPACHILHTIPYGEGEKHQWNGSVEFPTLTPDVYIRLKDGRGVCSFLLLNGLISYLEYSTHWLQGLTVPMLDFRGPFERRDQL